MPVRGADRPNILFLLTDDQRHDTIAALGNDQIRTPHLDRLVASGVAFRKAYIMGSSSPQVGSASRASLLSGRTLWNLASQGDRGFEIPDKFPTLPQVFRENGYVTFATGKNYPGRDGAFARSFSSGDKILFREIYSQDRLPLHNFAFSGQYPRSGAVMHEGRHSAEVYAEACIRFLASRIGKDEPFFAYIAFQTPHDPRKAPAPYRVIYEDEKMKLPSSFVPEHPFDNGMLKARDEMLAPFPRTEEVARKHLADYYATISHTDAQIGRIVAALEQNGQREETIIVFTSDNGLALGSHGLMGKQNLYEHSLRIPLVMAGPGIPAGQKRNQLCYLGDLYPTLCERARLEVPATVQFQSLNPVLASAQRKHREHLSFAFMSWQRSVRDQRYKLIEYCVEGARHTQLFDLRKDPEETNNLAGDPAQAGTVARMRRLLEEERLHLNDGNSESPSADRQGKAFWTAYEKAAATTTP